MIASIYKHGYFMNNSRLRRNSLFKTLKSYLIILCLTTFFVTLLITVTPSRSVSAAANYLSLADINVSCSNFPQGQGLRRTAPQDFTSFNDSLTVQTPSTEQGVSSASGSQNSSISLDGDGRVTRIRSQSSMQIFAQRTEQGIGGVVTAIARSNLTVQIKVIAATTYSLQGSFNLSLIKSPQNGGFGTSFFGLQGPNFSVSGGASGSASDSKMVNESGTLLPGDYVLQVFGDVESLGASLPGTSDCRADWNITLTLGSPRRPVIIIPGIAGTYAANLSNDEPWLLTRGVPPIDTQIDPLARAYHDLIQTLKNTGYVEGKDLFVVNYDWRLPPGPNDGHIDGVINGISAASISDQNFEYSVDYLGAELRRAVEAWATNNSGSELEEVDVIAHSTGGLVARTYIQSAAYGATFDAFGTKKLPKIKNLIMVGVPNRGASKAWNPLQNNWVADPAYIAVLSKIVNRAYQKVLSGSIIAGPLQPITRASIDDNGSPSPIKFINQYVPTIRSLLATYNFIDFGAGLTNVNSDPSTRNSLLLDLNAGLDLMPTADPSPFAGKCTATIIYGTSVFTNTSVRQRIGPSGSRVIVRFTDFVPRDALPNEVWSEDIGAFVSGDGTVPLDSSRDQFVGDSRVSLKPFGQVTHLGLMFNFDVQKLILQTLGVSSQDSNISTTLHAGIADSLWASAGIVGGSLVMLLDPVEGFVVDGAGRRLGYSRATGALTEIPNSIWFGNASGMGWVIGPLQEPLTLQLIGLNEPYYVMVSADTGADVGGLVDSGFLTQGEKRTLPIPIFRATQFRCPLGHGFWKNHSGSWPVSSLTLGSQSYTQSEILTILNTPVGAGQSADASLILARQLVAAKLSIASGSDPAPISATIAETDSLLRGYSGKLPYSVSPSSATGQAMVNKADLLERYNTGQMTPGCNP